jgi:hypothetical protein
MMELEEAKAFLKGFQHLSVAEQRKRLDDVNAAFEVFWQSSPAMEEFDDVMSGVILTPKILYRLCRRCE